MLGGEGERERGERGEVVLSRGRFSRTSLYILKAREREMRRGSKGEGERGREGG
jgi:hypothetical protein